MTSELKQYDVTDHQDNGFEVRASQVTVEDSWLKFYDGSNLIAAFFQPAGFILTEED